MLPKDLGFSVMRVCGMRTGVIVLQSLTTRGRLPAMDANRAEAPRSECPVDYDMWTVREVQRLIPSPPVNHFTKMTCKSRDPRKEYASDVDRPVGEQGTSDAHSIT